MTTTTTPTGWTPELWAAVTRDADVRAAVRAGRDPRAAIAAAMRRYLDHLERLTTLWSWPDPDHRRYMAVTDVEERMVEEIYARARA